MIQGENTETLALLHGQRGKPCRQGVYPLHKGTKRAGPLRMDDCWTVREGTGIAQQHII